MKQLSRMIAAAGIAAAIVIKPAVAEDKSLYLRLGGYDAIAAVTDDFLARLEKDDKLGRFFIGVSDDSLGASASTSSTWSAPRRAGRASTPAVT